ncbi:MAG: hypothetical protein MZV70_52240 [Desulfobacterales bacterium]|nr:hypothetical protein [Desulfobacterales bacterium]
MTKLRGQLLRPVLRAAEAGSGRARSPSPRRLAARGRERDRSGERRLDLHGPGAITSSRTTQQIERVQIIGAMISAHPQHRHCREPGRMPTSWAPRSAKIPQPVIVGHVPRRRAAFTPSASFDGWASARPVRRGPAALADGGFRTSSNPDVRYGLSPSFPGSAATTADGATRSCGAS